MKKIITTVSAMTLTIPAGHSQADDNSTVTMQHNGAEYNNSNEGLFQGSGFVDLTVYKTVEFTADNDSSGDITLGDELRYTVEVINTESSSVSGVVMLDFLEPQIELNLGSVAVTQGAVLNGNLIMDDPGFVYVDFGTIAPNWFTLVNFDVTVIDLEPGLNVISNSAEVYGPSGTFFLSDDPTTSDFDSTDVDAYGALPDMIFANGFDDRPPSGGF